MKRTIIILCRAYHVPQLSRVAIFPLHMDPPTIQHREIFRLLLGQPLPADGMPASSSPSSRTAITNSTAAVAASASTLTSSSAIDMPGAGTSAMGDGGFQTNQRSDRHNTRLSRLWYLESFAQCLQSDSQLTPFDDLILVPNTRYPVALRRSTHLAALAVMATQDMPGVHVDFTALEHPDESMPIVYELTRHYPNSVLVHTLQDAYEMQNWRHFTDMKVEVPILFLQTRSLPVKMLKQSPPTVRDSHAGESHNADHTQDVVARDATVSVGSTATSAASAASPASAQAPSTAQPNTATKGNAMSKASPTRSGTADKTEDEPRPRTRLGDGPRLRQYHTAEELKHLGGVSHSPDEQHYYTRVAEVLRAAAARRRERGVDASGGRAERARGLANYDEDSLDLPATQHDAECVPGVLQEGYTAVHLIDKHGSRNNMTSQTSSGSNASRHANSEPPSLPRRAWSLVTGEWWRTRGGRGDEEVEASRSYNSFSGSSWLVAPFSASEETEIGGAERGAWVSEEEKGTVAAKAKANAKQDGEAQPDTVADLAGPGEWSTEDVVVTSDGSVVVRSRRHATGSHLTTTTTSSSSRTAPAAKETIADADLPEGEVLYEADEDINEEEEKDVVAYDAATFAEQVKRVTRELDDILTANSALASTPTATTTTTTATTVPALAATPRRPATRQQHHRRRPHRTQRRVRELIEELFPPSLYGHHPKGCFVYSPPPRKPEPGLHEDATPSASTPTPTPTPARTPDRFLWHEDGPGEARADDSPDATTDSNATLHVPSPVDFTATDDLSGAEPHVWHPSPLEQPLVPMIEVLPVTRTTGADVRQALWEQTMDPACLLPDRVLRYAESHGLYRDARKASHAAQYYSSSGGQGLPSSSTTSSATTAGGGGGGGGGGSGSPSSLGSYFAGAGGMATSAMRRRNPAPRESATMFLPGIVPRVELHYDKNNLLAREQYEKLKVFQCQDGQEPDLIVPIGGDGYMMHCIRKNWRRFIPFYGINAGHVGYLLNDCATLEELFASPLKLHTTNMLYCQAEKETATGERVVMAELAFNDAWLERSSGQTALIRILVNGEERIHRLRGDGVLVSTAAGSTAYSQALGASPVPVSAPLIQVVGSNVVSPAQWRPAHLDQEDQVELEVIDNVKRPCRCFVDAVDVGQVTRMLVRSSRVAGVTLAFSTSCDLQHKLYQMQFPRTL